MHLPPAPFVNEGYMNYRTGWLNVASTAFCDSWVGGGWMERKQKEKGIAVPAEKQPSNFG
jgi:hypothetical protein